MKIPEEFRPLSDRMLVVDAIIALSIGMIRDTVKDAGRTLNQLELMAEANLKELAARHLEHLVTKETRTTVHQVRIPPLPNPFLAQIQSGQRARSRGLKPSRVKGPHRQGPYFAKD